VQRQRWNPPAVGWEWLVADGALLTADPASPLLEQGCYVWPPNGVQMSYSAWKLLVSVMTGVPLVLILPPGSPVWPVHPFVHLSIYPSRAPRPFDTDSVPAPLCQAESICLNYLSILPGPARPFGTDSVPTPSCPAESVYHPPESSPACCAGCRRLSVFCTNVGLGFYFSFRMYLSFWGIICPFGGLLCPFWGYLSS
jgi:hypothetical protein